MRVESESHFGMGSFWVLLRDLELQAWKMMSSLFCTPFLFFFVSLFLKCCCCLGIYLIMPSVLFFNQNAAPHIKF